MKDTRGVNHLEINCASADGRPDITYYVADDTSGELFILTLLGWAFASIYMSDLKKNLHWVDLDDKFVDHSERQISFMTVKIIVIKLAQFNIIRVC